MHVVRPFVEALARVQRDRLLGAPSAALAMLSRQVDAQAVMLATNDFYAMATVLMFGSILVVWLIKRPKGPLKAVSH